jgi:hypothetical protein
MTTRRSLLTLAALVFAWGCAPVTTAPPPVTPATARTAYVRDTPALIASPTARAALAERLAARQLTAVAPYQLAPLLVDADGRTRLAGWIDEVHRAGGQVIVPIGGAARIGPLTQVIAEHPGTWIDGAVTEDEYWNRADRAAALTELLDLLDALGVAGPALAPGRGLRIGAYLGYPTAAEAAELAARLDFVYLDYSVATPRDAWVHVHAKGGPLRDRYGWFAQAGVEAMTMNDTTRHEISARVGLPGAIGAAAALLGHDADLGPAQLAELTRLYAMLEVAFLAAAADGEINDAEADNLGATSVGWLGTELSEDDRRARHREVHHRPRRRRPRRVGWPRSPACSTPTIARPPTPWRAWWCYATSSCTITSSTCWASSPPASSCRRTRPRPPSRRSRITSRPSSPTPGREPPSAHGTGSFSAYQ